MITSLKCVNCPFKKDIFYREEIPFINAAPIDEAETKKAKKQKEGAKK